MLINAHINRGLISTSVLSNHCVSKQLCSNRSLPRPKWNDLRSGYQQPSCFLQWEFCGKGTLETTGGPASAKGTTRADAPTRGDATRSSILCGPWHQNSEQSRTALTYVYDRVFIQNLTINYGNLLADRAACGHFAPCRGSPDGGV